jgi:hypothetical protein
MWLRRGHPSDALPMKASDSCKIQVRAFRIVFWIGLVLALILLINKDVMDVYTMVHAGYELALKY